MSVRPPIVILALGGMLAVGLLGLAWRETATRDALRQTIAREAAVEQRLRAQLAAAETLRAKRVSSMPAAKVDAASAATPAPKRV